MRKKTLKGVVRIDAYAVVLRAVEEGVQRGWERGHKYGDSPTREVLTTAIEDAVLLALGEVLSFERREQ